MNRNMQFAMLIILSVFSLLLVGVYTAHAQEKSDTDRRRTQTDVPVEPAPSQRGDVAPVPQREGATSGPTDVHPETRQRRAPEAVRQTRPHGAQAPQADSSSSSFPGPISDVHSAIKVLPQNSNTRFKTPCGSPECQSQALAIKKQSTAKSDLISATSGQVTGSGFKGTARTGRR
jgi:hypothetical protein